MYIHTYIQTCEYKYKYIFSLDLMLEFIAFAKQIPVGVCNISTDSDTKIVEIAYLRTAHSTAQEFSRIEEFKTFTRM